MARPQNVLDFVVKAAKTYNNKNKYRHKMQKRLFIRYLKHLFYLKYFIQKISFEISML